MEIDAERLRDDIETNAAFGNVDVAEGRGRTVLTGNEADEQAREYFVERLDDAGLDVRIDSVGNIAGRWTPPSADPDAAPVAAGSHLDSVPNGGIFDGPLGVYAALEAVRTLQESDVSPGRPVDVVSFTEEEGARFGIGLLGSSVVGGLRSATEARELTDDEGTTLAEHLDSIGFDGEGVLDAGAWDCWLEVHIEQNTKLESTGATVGVVDAITGIANCQVHIGGEADHAGATPMYDRNDALTVASEFTLDFQDAAREMATQTADTAVGTVGEFEVSPNARNIVPGAVDLSLDIRDIELERMRELVDRARSSLNRLDREHDVDVAFEQYREQAPSHMADRCVDALRRAATDADLEALDMYSAAMHDTANVANETDCAMFFVPSEDGISHNPREWTDWADCAAGARVLAGAIAELTA